MDENLSKEIIGLEKKYWQSMQDHDLLTAVKLTDFPCIVAGQHGARSVDKEQFIEMFNSHEAETVRSFKFDDSKTEVRQLGPDIAVVAYQINTTFTKDGKTRIVNAIDSSTWVKRGDKWACAMHTETELLPQ